MSGSGNGRLGALRAAAAAGCILGAKRGIDGCARAVTLMIGVAASSRVSGLGKAARTCEGRDRAARFGVLTATLAESIPASSCWTDRNEAPNRRILVSTAAMATTTALIACHVAAARARTSLQKV